VGFVARTLLPGGGAMTSVVRSTDGTRIAYTHVGTGRPVVIVHGGLGTSEGWQRVAALLSTRFRVFVFDRRGRGASGDSAAHSLDREVEDLEAVLDVAGGGAALVGHSFGGAVALEAARRADPAAVSALAVYEPAVGVGGTIARAALSEMEELIELGDADAALDVAIAGLDSAGLVHADPRPPGSRRPERVLALAPTVPRELRAVTAPGLRLERYAALAVPALVLGGTRSPEYQLRNCERLAATLPHGGLAWLEGLGHVAHTAAPQVVAEAVATFIASATASSSAA
jgi:pimeloyl-ACP methyl ester carboxylesterase